MVKVGVHMEGRPGHVHQAQGTYNPISNQWVDAPDGTVAHSAGDRSRQHEQDWYNAKTGTSLGIAILPHQASHLHSILTPPLRAHSALMPLTAGCALSPVRITSAFLLGTQPGPKQKWIKASTNNRLL